MLMAAPQIISVCLNSGFKIMILFSIAAGVSVVFYSKLPETFGKRTLEIIRELEPGYGYGYGCVKNS